MSHCPRSSYKVIFSARFKKRRWSFKLLIQQKCIELVNRKSIVFHRENTKTTCIFTQLSKAIAGRLEYVTSSTVNAQHCSFKFSLVSAFEIFYGCHFNNKEHEMLYFERKDRNYYERGILKFPERWQTIANKIFFFSFKI